MRACLGMVVGEVYILLSEERLVMTVIVFEWALT